MNYTLYIDESGDFESQKGQWIISGVLFQEKYDEIESVLKNKFHNMPEELNLKSIRDFHLTEFRRGFCHADAVDMAKKTLSRLDFLPFNYHFLTTINYTKTSLSNREKTYRLMLADLLALCETTLEENERIDNLDLVVATRTIDGVLQTNISNIQKDIIDTLPIAFEVDLATKGMVDLTGKHIKIHMDYANNSWGLVCADFLANLTYHNRKENEQKYFAELESKNKYTNFESFGDFESRKASVAQRDGDYVLSLYRWLKILNDNPRQEKPNLAINSVLEKFFSKKGTTGSYIAFEALIERLWRSNNKPYQYQELSSILRIFEDRLSIFFVQNCISDFDQYLFRLRNLMLIVENHLGNTNLALKIAQKQNESLGKIATNPENFDLALNFKSIEVEIYVNDLNFEKALELSSEYSNTIETFKEVWALMVDKNDDGFERSRGYIKSKMIQFRIELLNNNTKIEISTIENKLTNSYDISRFENYKIMLLLKQNRPKMAVDYYINALKEKKELTLNYFDLFWFLKSANEAFLNNDTLNNTLINNLVQKQIEKYDFNKVGHPIDLILRELALFEFNKGDKSQALRLIRKSKNAVRLENSNIAKWLMALSDMYEDYFKDKLKDEIEYFKEIKNTSFYKTVDNNTSLDLFKKARYYSPY